jgi:hypothetical protein
VFVLFAPWSGGGPALADRALAALGANPMLHVVVDRPVSVHYVELATGAPQQLFERQEIWYDRAHGLVHTVTRAHNGSLLDDVLQTPHGGWTQGGPVLDCTWVAAHPQEATKLRVSCNANGDNGTTPHVVPRPVPTVDSALGGFLDGYQQALANGLATQTGTGTLDGKNVIWLSFPFAQETESVALDASSYRPLLVRDASGTWSYRIISIETVAQSAANFERPTATELGRQAASGTRVDRTQLPIDPGAARQALPGAARLGSSFHDLPLAGIERDNLRTTFGDASLPPEDGLGLQLVYGANHRRRRSRPDAAVRGALGIRPSAARLLVAAPARHRSTDGHARHRQHDRLPRPRRRLRHRHGIHTRPCTQSRASTRPDHAVTRPAV